MARKPMEILRADPCLAVSPEPRFGVVAAERLAKRVLVLRLGAGVNARHDPALQYQPRAEVDTSQRGSDCASRSVGGCHQEQTWRRQRSGLQQLPTGHAPPCRVRAAAAWTARTILS